MTKRNKRRAIASADGGTLERTVEGVLRVTEDVATEFDVLHLIDPFTGERMLEGASYPKTKPLVVMAVGTWQQHDPALRLLVTDARGMPQPYDMFADPMGTRQGQTFLTVIEHIFKNMNVAVVQTTHNFVTVEAVGVCWFEGYGTLNSDAQLERGLLAAQTLNIIDTKTKVEEYTERLRDTYNVDWPLIQSQERT